MKEEEKKPNVLFAITSDNVWKVLTVVLAIALVFVLLKGGDTTTVAPTAPSNPGQPAAPSAPGEFTINVGDAPVKGDDKAKVMIVEFSDYECPFCGRFYTGSLPELNKNYVETGKAKLAFKDFPLSFHQQAQKASEAAECAGEQGQYWEMHDKLFENQKALTVPSLKQYAAGLGLNTADFDSCLDSGKFAQNVQDDFKEGQVATVSGTPSFFLIAPKKDVDVETLKGLSNGQTLVYGESPDGKDVVFKIVGAQPYTQFVPVLNAME